MPRIGSTARLVALVATLSTLVACATTNGGEAPSPSGSFTSTRSDLNWSQAPGPFARATLNGGQYSIDLGDGETAQWNQGAPLNFVYFLQGTSNTYLQAESDGATAAAKAVGANLTLVNADFDAATQRAQLQNALASGKYNGAAIRPVSSTGSCALLTKDAPRAGVPVVVVVQETCGRDNNAGAELWSPGTLAYVGGGGGSYPFYEQWALEIAKRMTRPTKTAVIVGPSQLAAVQVTNDVLRKAADKYSNLDIVATNFTDFTDAGGLAATQNILQAHPDVEAIILEYGGQTPSVIRGIAQAGRAGKVSVYEAGGDKAAKQELLDGTLTMSAAQFPYTAAYCAVELLAAAHSGLPIPHVVYNDCSTQPGDPTTTKPLFLTKDNIAGFTPDY